MSTAPAPEHPDDELRAAVAALLPDVRRRADEGERERHLPADLAADLEAAGVFRMLRVRGLGGLDADPATVLDVVERLAHADASTAWVALIGATASAFFDRLDPDTARTMLAERPGAAASCVFAPSGTAAPDPSGGFRVSGHWGWNSGIDHAAWRQVGTVETGPDGRPVTDDDGAPRVRVALLPATAGRVVEHWDTMGLRGTGSHDLVVEDVLVPTEHTFLLADGPRTDGPAARRGLFDLVHLGVVTFPLGIARRALDEFVAETAAKTRGLATRWSVSGDAEVQADIGRADADLAAARALADAAAGELGRALATGEDLASAQQRLEMATGHALRTALRVVDTAFGHAGASTIRLDHPLQRCFRDLHAVAGHVFYAAESDRVVGRRRLAAG